MPPKRVKSGTVSAAGATAVGNKGWETGLTTASFEEVGNVKSLLTLASYNFSKARYLASETLFKHTKL